MMKQMWKSVFFASSSLLVASSAWSQCESWESYPEGVEKAKELQMNYRRLFKENKFDEAFPIWEKLFAHVKAPKESPIIHFVDGIKMYKEKMKAEKDPAVKGEQLKTMIALYEQQMKCAGETAEDRAWQGYDMYLNDADPKATLKIFDRALELSKNNLSQIAIAPMSYLAVWLFEKNDPDVSVEYMRKLYDKLKATVDAQVAAGKDAAKYKEKWEKAEGYFNKIGGKLWGCDFFVNKWKPLFEKDSDNFEQNTQIVQELKAKCNSDNEFYQKVYAKYTVKKAELDSIDFWTNKYPALSPFEKAEACSKEAKRLESFEGMEPKSSKLLAEAEKHYEEALKDPNLDKESRAKIAYRLAYKEYKKGNYSDARTLCRQASDLLPNWGEPYMLVGYMYAASGSRCDPSGKGTGWDAQVVAWAAVDEWSRAKEKDPSVADEANGLIAKYRQYFPLVGEGFQRGIKNGDSYKIGCWMNVTTTVRLKD